MFDFEFYFDDKEKKVSVSTNTPITTPEPKRTSDNPLDPIVPRTYSVPGAKFGDRKIVRVSPGGRISIFSGWS